MGRHAFTHCLRTRNKGGENGATFKGGQVNPHLVLPAENRENVMGHQKFHKTLAHVQEAYVWPGMRATVREFMEACPICVHYNQQR